MKYVNNPAGNPTLPIRQVMADLLSNTQSMEASTSMSTTQSLKTRIFGARSKLEHKLSNKANDLMNLSEKCRKLDSGSDSYMFINMLSLILFLVRLG